MARFIRNYSSLTLGTRVFVTLAATGETIEMKVVQIPENFKSVSAMTANDRFIFERRRGRGVRMVEARRYGNDCYLVADVPGIRTETRLSRVHLSFEKVEQPA